MDSRMVFAIVAVLFVENVNHIASSQLINDPDVPCHTNEDCRHPGLPRAATCSSNFCVCMDANGVPQKCKMSHSQARVPAAHSNPPMAHICKTNWDCEKLPHAYCNTTVNQCTCDQGFVMSVENFECLPISRSLGSSCSQDEQCSLPNTTCRNGQCICTPGFHYTENACWKTAEMDKPCKYSQECNHVVNAMCNEKSICSCAPQNVLSSDGKSCLPVAKEMMESCVDSIQCSTAYPGAECIKEKCTCTENNHFARSERRCIISKHLGENCTKDNECYQDAEAGEENREAQSCMAGICTCNENFTKNENRCTMNSGASSLTPVFVAALLCSALLFSRH